MKSGFFVWRPPVRKKAGQFLGNRRFQFDRRIGTFMEEDWNKDFF